jgi:hypothetical protein
MEREGQAAKLGDWLWFLFWAVLSSAWCVTAAAELGPTFDEPFYLTKGLEHWRTGSYKGLMKAGSMPLPVDVETLPLRFWEKSRGAPFDPALEMDAVLPIARAANLVFWWLLLFYARLVGRQLAGPWAGRLAVAFLAAEPCLLAHASLATTDISITACLVALVYHFRVGREAAWWQRVGLPGLWFGAALLAKASGLVFGPLCLVVVELDRLLRDRWSGMPTKLVSACNSVALQPGWLTRLGTWLMMPLSPAFRPLRRDLGQIMLLGLGIMFVYCGSDWQREPTFVQWAHSLPESAQARSLVWLSDNLRIFTNAGEGIVQQVKHNIRGHDQVFLLGRTMPRAVWYYFPVALTIKTSLPLLFMPLLLIFIAPRACINWAFFCALALLLFSVTCRVQIGIRFMLPLVAFTAAGLAGALVIAARQQYSFIVYAVALAGLAWSAGASLAVWPNALCYTNELWGGTSDGFLRLSDSNYDWGQGLKELARWRDRRAIQEIDVWYFGMDPAIASTGFRQVPLHILPIGSAKDFQAAVGSRYLAVSTTLLYGVPIDTPSYRQAVAFIAAHRPVDRTSTFLIYDFSDTSRADRR